MKSRFGPLSSLPALRAGLLLTLAIVCANAAPAAAQSVFATRGLGYLIEPVDARARAMGGVDLGLPDPQLSWSNPASAVGIVAPGLVFAYQYDNFDSDQLGSDLEGKTARFPLLLAGAPIGGRAVLQIGVGSFLDQNWQFERPDTLILGAGDTIPVVDRLTSEGGAARVRLGIATRVVESLAVGFALDLYTGTLSRSQGRVFPAGDYVTGRESARWSYGGVGTTAGVHWSPGEAVGIGLAVTAGGTLEATDEEGSTPMTSYELPGTVRAGVSGRIGQETLVALSGSWSGWSSLDEALAAEGGARDTYSLEGGAEWAGIVIRDRRVPVRLGARTTRLPFRWAAGETTDWADENALSVGLGLMLAGGAVRPDLAAEFGSRGGDASGTDESFWRFAFSIAVLGR